MKPFRRDPVRDGLLVLTVIAVLTAGWFGWSWASASWDADLAYAAERDAVVDAAARGLVVLHTIDHRSATTDLDAWNAVTAGSLHADLSGDRPGQVKRAQAGKVVSTARLVRAAVTELDTHGGTARVIAVLRVSLATKGGKPAEGGRRMNAELVRTDTGWKVSTVEAAA